VLQESLRETSNSINRGTSEGKCVSNGPSRRQSLGGADNISKPNSNGFLTKRTSSFQIRSSVSSSSILKNAKGASKSFDGGSRSLERSKILLNGKPPSSSFNQSSERTKDKEENNNWKGSLDDKPNDLPLVDTEDNVPGVLYDFLQKEVLVLRKAGHEKDQSLKDKDDAIEVSNIFKPVWILIFHFFFTIAILANCCNGHYLPDASKESGYIDQSYGS